VRSYAQRFMGFGMEIPGEFALDDAGNEADMVGCCAEWTGSDCVAEGFVEPDRCGMRPSVQSRLANGLAGKAVQGQLAQMRLREQWRPLLRRLVELFVSSTL
jgi:hypothetical protein